MKEIWKDIKGYEGLYQVSNLGRVKSMDRCVKTINNSTRLIKGKVLSAYITSNGYYRLSLCKEGVEKRYFVHRLVAEAFIQNPDNLPQINHKDENKLNNCVDNLEWTSAKYNCNYGTRIKRIAQKNKISHCKKVYQYTLDGEFIREWESALQVQIQLGYCASCIRRCCNGQHHYVYNFVWNYSKV